MQKEIQLTDKTLLVVSVPKEAYDIKVRQNSEQSDLWYTQDLAVPNVSSWINLPLSHWQFVGIYPELTEDMAHSLVEHTFDGNLKKYFNYKKGYYSHSLFTALESFQSLMEREKCYTVNPLKFDPTGITTGEWQEAQKTTYDKYAILIKSK